MRDVEVGQHLVPSALDHWQPVQGHRLGPGIGADPEGSVAVLDNNNAGVRHKAPDIAPWDLVDDDVAGYPAGLEAVVSGDYDGHTLSWSQNEYHRSGGQVVLPP